MPDIPMTLDQLIDFAVSEGIPFTAELFWAKSFRPDSIPIPVQAITGYYKDEEAAIVIGAF